MVMTYIDVRGKLLAMCIWMFICALHHLHYMHCSYSHSRYQERIICAPVTIHIPDTITISDRT